VLVQLGTGRWGELERVDQARWFSPGLFQEVLEVPPRPGDGEAGAPAGGLALNGNDLT
jgi:hypothetical protein